MSIGPLASASVYNALDNNHFVDYLLHTELKDHEHNKTDFDEHRRQEKLKLKEEVASFMRGKTDVTSELSSRELVDRENNIYVLVDYVLSGSTIRAAFPTDDWDPCAGDSYPVLVRNVSVGHKRRSNCILNTATTKKIKVDLTFACQALGVSTGVVVGKNMKMGILDLDNYDSDYRNVAHRAASWAHYIRSHHSTMSIDPPSAWELYPNMKVADEDSVIASRKKAHALKNHEITLIWQLGQKEREICLSKGITSWVDDRLSSSMFNFGDAKSKALDTILEANRSCAKIVVRRDLIKDCCEEGDVFIDIETLGNMHEISDFVFMVGLGYGRDEFKCIVADTVDMEGEKVVINEMLEFLRSVGCKRLLHWAPYEVKVFTEVENRHSISFLPLFQWIDLCEEVKNSGFCPRGAFNFSLKSVVPAMHDLGMIEIMWDSSCTNGHAAMISAFNAYKTRDRVVLEDIESYNRVDVVSTMQIWRYLLSIKIRI